MNKKIFSALLFFSLTGINSAFADCFDSVAALKSNKIKTTWAETSADDGVPLVINIFESEKGLNYKATKGGQLWLKGSVDVCANGGAPTITLTDTVATDNVPAMAKGMLGGTKKMTVKNNQIVLGGFGWSGTFVGQ